MITMTCGDWSGIKCEEPQYYDFFLLNITQENEMLLLTSWKGTYIK